VHRVEAETRWPPAPISDLLDIIAIDTGIAETIYTTDLAAPHPP
jgi:hypothetical protein